MSGPGPSPSRLTAEQRRAIELKSASIALGAGAGCGKTTVLTERFLDEIEGQAASGEGRALNALVALTFTEKAARELRQRIRARCREKLRDGSGTGRWLAVLRALEAAPIGTFHEFCGGLLREQALDLGIDPDFAILNETVAGALRDEAIRAVLRKLLAARDPDLLSLGVDYGLRRVREALEVVLSRRAGLTVGAAGEAAPEELVERWRQFWVAQGRPAVLRTLQPSAAACRVALQPLEDGHARLRERRAALLALLPDLETGSCDDGTLAEVRELAKVSDLRSKDLWPSSSVKESVQDAFEALRKRIDAALKKLTVSESATLASAEHCLRLTRLAGHARREYDRIKAGRRGLDFDDLLLRTLELLDAGPGQAPHAAAMPLEFILVDEFQDTDRTQSEILRRLGGEGFVDGRMFVVGDTKQSIYRFRGAEPAIFDRWRAAFPEPGQLLLGENFRSVPGVIHFVNALFADSFGDGPPGDPASAAAHRLAPVRPDGFSDPAVTFLWALPATPDEEGEQDDRGSLAADERRGNEAKALASWLRRRLDRGWTIVDRQTREPRRAHAGDVAFLFRAMTDVWPYETALADWGFDYHTVGGSAFFAQQEVRDAVNVLSVVEDPLDEVALAGALRSPFFSLSDEGLFWLARKFAGGLSEGLPRAATIAELSDRDRRAAVGAAESLARWRQLKDHIPLARLVATVLEESGFEAAIACEFLGSRKLANTRKLVRLARDFDVQERFTLGDLVARLRADLDTPPREEQASTTEENSETVRLMSIHQAKGLEFPIVVVPDLNRNAGSRDVLVGLHPDLGLLLRPTRTAAAEPGGPPDAEPEEGGCLGWMAFQAIEAEEERRESLRLFYVAATRARDHLVLSAGLDEGPDAKGTEGLAALEKPRAWSPAFALLLERFDWHSGECLATLPQGWPSPRVEVLWQRAEEPPSDRPLVGRGLGLPEIERILTRTPLAPAATIERAAPWPGWIDLGRNDRMSAGRPARLVQLLRLALGDPGFLRGDEAETACARAGRRLSPVATSRLLAEAAGCLSTWNRTALHAELAEASGRRRPIDVGVEWSLLWSPGGETQVAIRGCLDLIYQDRAGRWRPVILAIEPRREPADRLRLALAEAAAHQIGRTPCGPAWWIEPGPDGSLQVQTELPPSPAAIRAAVTRWLEEHRAP